MLRRGFIQPVSRSSPLLSRGFAGGKKDERPPPRQHQTQSKPPPRPPQQQTQSKPREQAPSQPQAQPKQAVGAAKMKSMISVGRLEHEISGVVVLVGSHAHLIRKLFKAAKAQNVVDRVSADLTKFLKWFNDDKNKAARLIEFGVMKPDKKKIFLDQFLSKLGLHDATLNFVRILAGAGQLGVIGVCQKDFKELASAERKEIVCTVLSAEPLSADTFERAKTAISAQALKFYPGLRVNVGNKVDSRLIGGLIFRVGTKIQDLSVERDFVLFETSMKQLA